MALPFLALGLIEFGSLFFWALALIPFILLIAAVEFERPFASAFSVLVWVALSAILLDRASVHYVIHHLPIFIPAYIGLGIAWGFVKWTFFVWKFRDCYEQLRQKFLAKTGATEITEKNRRDFGDYLSHESLNIMGRRLIFQGFPPKASENKGRIIFWMAYWPASAAWTILNDPVTRLYQFLYRRLVGVLDGISKAMFAKYANDFKDTRPMVD